VSRRYHDEAWLREKYRDEGWTQREIAEECGVSPRAIRKYMNRFDIETRDVEGENHPQYGTERDDSVKEAISEELSGREFSDDAREQMSDSHLGNEIPSEVRGKISEALSGIPKPPETRERMSKSRTGSDNPNWRGGHIRDYGPGWTAARRKVDERDGVCQLCGHDGSEQTLDVHHIVPVRKFREDPNSTLRDAHELDNLILLCRSCHMDVEHGNATVDTASRDGDE
jgi:5-methylcytosine-specific restriction endonuclease McrA